MAMGPRRRGRTRRPAPARALQACRLRRHHGGERLGHELGELDGCLYRWMLTASTPPERHVLKATRGVDVGCGPNR